MTTLDAGSYQVHIESDSLGTLGKQLAGLISPCHILPVSDDRVWPLYGDTVTGSLLESGFTVAEPFVFPNGEKSKSLSTWESLVETLPDRGITRSDCIIALGGGVVGDLAGFSAAVYQRGIRFIQVPTSLLAMVDSSVGGKTAIDLPSEKNMIGAFHEPSYVLCDPAVLRTLPSCVMNEGMAEIIKTAILAGGDLFSQLMNGSFTYESVIAECIQYKIGIVCKDYRDNGERHKLNLGHTVAHAIELLSDYNIPHGNAVSAGLSLIARSTFAAGLCDNSVSVILDNLLKRYELPFELWKNWSADDLSAAALHDKKRLGNTIDLVLPYAVGDCRILNITTDSLSSFLKAGMEVK